MSAFEGAYAKALQLGAPRGHRGHQVQLCFNIATGVVFWVCFFWEDLLGSLCFVESCSATSQRFNPKSAVIIIPAFPAYFVWWLCNYAPWKTRQIQKVRYTSANEVPRRTAFEKDSSLLTTILYARQRCVHRMEIFPEALQRLEANAGKASEKLVIICESLLSYHTPLMVNHTFLELFSTWLLVWFSALISWCFTPKLRENCCLAWFPA